MDLNIIFNQKNFTQKELNYYSSNQLKNLLNYNFKELVGFSIYYDNAELNKLYSEYTPNNIIAVSVYELNGDKNIVHKLFIKSNGKFELRKSLLENLMSTKNQVFALSYYFPNLVVQKVIGISEFMSSEYDFDKTVKQKNEFNLFRLVNTYNGLSLKNKNLSKRNKFLRLGSECGIGCPNDGEGACNGSWYCDLAGERPMCEKEDASLSMEFRGIIDPSSTSILFKTELYYNLRDNLMQQYNVGEKYIDYYYAISAFIQNSDYDYLTLIKMMNTLPEFNTALEKLLISSYNGEVIIINEELKNDILSIISDLRDISTNSDYQTILNDLENDIIFIGNKSKQDVINGLY